MKSVKMIFAIGKDGLFALAGNKLPFNSVADMQHFRNYTKGSIVLMGAKTFQSLPKRLGGRLNVVYASGSRGMDIYAQDGSQMDVFIDSDKVTLEHAINLLQKRYCIESVLRNEVHKSVRPFCNDDASIIVIGGLEILKQAVALVDEISISVFDNVHGDPDKDIFAADFAWSLLGTCLGVFTEPNISHIHAEGLVIWTGTTYKGEDNNRGFKPKLLTFKG